MEPLHRHNVTEVRFEPEPHLCEPLFAVRFSQVQIGSVSGSPLGHLRRTRASVGARVRTRPNYQFRLNHYKQLHSK